jgi:hypothetical protein
MVPRVCVGSSEHRLAIQVTPESRLQFSVGLYKIRQREQGVDVEDAVLKLADAESRSRQKAFRRAINIGAVTTDSTIPATLACWAPLTEPTVRMARAQASQDQKEHPGAHDHAGFTDSDRGGNQKHDPPPSGFPGRH